jgi:hypothetical protein
MSKFYFELKLSYDDHAKMLLFQALSLFLTTPLYAEVDPHSIHNVMQCKGEGGEAAYQSLRQRRYSATVLVHISPKGNKSSL